MDSFRFRIFSVNTAVVSAAILIISAVAVIISSSTISKNINDQMTLKLDSLSDAIELKLNEHSSLVKSLALLGDKNAGNISISEHMIILKNMSMANADSFGFGIWYEPYLYKRIRYYGAYVYRQNGEPVYTTAYSRPPYDFHNRQWYIDGKKPELPGKIAWSVPVFENASGVTLISAVSPFFDSNHSILGVTAGDFDISCIKKIIEETPDKNPGICSFLLSPDGTLLASSDKTLLNKKKIDEFADKDFTALFQILKKTKSGMAPVQYSGSPASVYFREISGTGWTLCLMVDTSSLYMPVWRIVYAALACFMLSILISAFSVRAISGRINNPVKLMNDFAVKISKGDFSERLPVEKDDAIGKLAQELNSSADSLEDRISAIKTAAENLSLSIDRTAKESTSLSGLASEQASVIEEIISIINENTSVIEQNAVDSRRAQSLTNEGIQKSSAGSSEASGVIESINEINESSSKISEITALINEIAFQTNLLALNAAIEAARAGEQGRGFAVVAGEVRNLARRSASAAKEIGQLIRESVTRVDRGTDLVLKTGEFMKDISSAAVTTAEIISGMVSATDEQKSGMEHIRMAVMKLDAMTQKSAAFFKINSDESRQMADQAMEMLALMRDFSVRTRPTGK